MKHFFLGIFTAVVIILLILFVLNIQEPKDIRYIGIYSSAFKIGDNQIMIFAKDYDFNTSNRVDPFVLVIDDNFDVYKQAITKRLIESDKYVIAESNNKDKVWLFSKEFDEWYEWDLHEKKFTTFKNKKYPNESDYTILTMSKKA